jgi:hypothetical protein
LRRLVEWLRANVDLWDLHIYGGLILVFVSLAVWSVVVAGSVAGLILLALGVFGPSMGDPGSEG